MKSPEMNHLICHHFSVIANQFSKDKEMCDRKLVKVNGGPVILSTDATIQPHLSLRSTHTGTCSQGVGHGLLRRAALTLKRCGKRWYWYLQTLEWHLTIIVAITIVMSEVSSVQKSHRKYLCNLFSFYSGRTWADSCCQSD